MNPFGIAPLLDKGVQFDPYALVLVAKIRSGRYSSDLWDCNGLYLDYVDRIEGRRDGQRRIAVKSRYTMTAEQRRAWNNSHGDPALNAERARKKEEAAKRNEEHERVEREWAETRARKKAEEERRNRDWAEREAEIAAERAHAAESVRLENQRKAILMNRWQCQKCKATVVKIEEQRKGYSLTCRRCGVSAWGAHKTLVGMLPPMALVA